MSTSSSESSSSLNPSDPEDTQRRFRIRNHRRYEQSSSLSPVQRGATRDRGPRTTVRRDINQQVLSMSDYEEESVSSDTGPDDNSERIEKATITNPSPNPRRKRSTTQSNLHKGNTEKYVKTVAKYTPAAAIPRTTSSKRKDGTEKRTLHRFTNEEHRFIWFYRNDLGCSRGDTYVHFNEYFGLHIRKDSIANTYERLKRKHPPEICDVQHTEAWAVGENYDLEHPKLEIVRDIVTMKDACEEDDDSDWEPENDTPTPVVRKRRGGLESLELPDLNADKLSEHYQKHTRGDIPVRYRAIRSTKPPRPLFTRTVSTDISIASKTTEPTVEPTVSNTEEAQKISPQDPVSASSTPPRLPSKRKVVFVDPSCDDDIDSRVNKRIKSPAED
ncbi:hypothetical protein HOY82DRAFT_641118 [Tuber indicum]|nr:hypothetical protein HOY82DRAFT_641118 [Tuber indicum]